MQGWRKHCDSVAYMCQAILGSISPNDSCSVSRRSYESDKGGGGGCRHPGCLQSGPGQGHLAAVGTPPGHYNQPSQSACDCRHIQVTTFSPHSHNQYPRCHRTHSPIYVSLQPSLPRCAASPACPASCCPTPVHTSWAGPRPWGSQASYPLTRTFSGPGPSRQALSSSHSR